MDEPGPNPVRQNAPHPAQVLLNTESVALLVPDVGADLVRIFQVTGSGSLIECPPLAVNPGDGPRHAVFFVDGEYRVFYVANELSNTITTYYQQFSAECIGFDAGKQILTPYPANKNLPQSASLAEIHLTGYDLFVSIRDDHGFGNGDSLAAMTVGLFAPNISAATISSTYGRTPRSFDILYAEDLIAIGNQATSTVAIVEIDPTTGRPGKLLVEIQVGEPGDPAHMEGLSSVLWRQAAF
jgi:6-phosphogluconolactonase (cycloisomerase 2 family)